MVLGWTFGTLHLGDSAHVGMRINASRRNNPKPKCCIMLCLILLTLTLILVLLALTLCTLSSLRAPLPC